MTLAELEFGVAKSARGAANRHRLGLSSRLSSWRPSTGAAAAYGALRASLESRGSPIGPLDTLLAAQALAARATLVTNNAREFGKVSGLKVETLALGGRAA